MILYVHRVGLVMMSSTKVDLVFYDFYLTHVNSANSSLEINQINGSVNSSTISANTRLCSRSETAACYRF